METEDELSGPFRITDEIYTAAMNIVHPREGACEGRKDAARMFVPEQREPTEDES